MIRRHSLLASGLHPFYRAILDYAVSQGWCVPSARIQYAQNVYVKRRVQTGQWAVDDIHYNFVNDACDINFSRINWKNPGTFTLSVNGSVSFTSLARVNGDGVSAYLGTGYVPSVDRINGSNHVNAYEVSTVVNGGATNQFEVGTPAVNFLRHNFRNASDVTQFTLGGGPINDASTDSSGHFLACRTSSSGGGVYHNGAAMGISPGSFIADISDEVTLFRHTTFYSQRGLRMFAMGGDYDPYGASADANFQAYLNSI